MAKVLCILRHQGVQLILAYSWARPAVLAAGMGRGGMFDFFCVFIFIHYLLSPLSLSFISSTTSSISLLPFSGRRHKMTHRGWHVVKPQHKIKPAIEVTCCHFVLLYILYESYLCMHMNGLKGTIHALFRREATFMTSFFHAKLLLKRAYSRRKNLLLEGSTL